MGISDRVHVSGNGLPLDLFDSAAARSAKSRDVENYRGRADRTQRQVDAYNALVTRRKRRQKRKSLSPWAARQPVTGALSAARSSSRDTPTP